MFTAALSFLAASALSWGGASSFIVGGGGGSDRCALASEGALSAAEEVARLDRTVRAIRTKAAAASALRDLGRVLQNQCFAVARFELEAIGPLPDVALPQWWTAGGRDWLRSHVERIPAVFGDDVMVFPPEAAPIASAERLGGLAHLLCPPFDDRCGAETIPWLESTQRDFETLTIPDEPEYYEGSCQKALLDFPAEQRYAAWWACIEGWRRRVPTLPVGRFRVPDRGWIFLREEVLPGGSSCSHPGNRVVLLNLEDGAALTASEELPSSNGGQAPGLSIQVGHVPPRRQREIGLALALAPLVQNQRRFDTHEVPRGVPILWTPVATTPPYVRTAVSIETPPSSWKWIAQDTLVTEGEFSRNEVRDVRGADATRGRVNRLLNAALLSLKPGCVSAPPTSTLTSRGKPLREVDVKLLMSVETVRRNLCARAVTPDSDLRPVKE